MKLPLLRFQRIIMGYEQNKDTDEFDISMVTDFNSAKNRICYKLINAEHNAVLLVVNIGF